MQDREQVGATIPVYLRTPEDVRAKLAAAGVEDDAIRSFLRLQQYAKDSHPQLGLSRLAPRVHVTQGILSPCFNGTYPGDYAAIAERIDSFFWKLEQQAKYGGLRQYVETDLAKALYVYFEKTRITRRILLLESPEQLGKSRIAREYTEQNNSGRTCYVKLPGGNKTGLGTFIRAVAEALNLPSTIKLSELRFRIKEALAGCDLVFIDEMHLIWTWNTAAIRDFFDYLRTDIHDDAKRGVVLISTNEDTLANIHRFKKSSGYNIGQLLGRMRVKPVVIDPEDDITEHDVLALTKRYYTPGKKALSKLHNLCCQPELGHFGLLDDILNEAWTLAKARKLDLNDELVLAVAQEILDDLAARSGEKRSAA
jgi:DNA transposition AAA+ family ATPase